jgi:formylglycine-generating enzyme required for sulfatase activity
VENVVGRSGVLCKIEPEGGKQIQLPSEAQWEYACRAGRRRRFILARPSAGSGELRWRFAYGRPFHKPFQLQRQPNAFGLYDMHGNVAIVPGLVTRIITAIRR